MMTLQSLGTVLESNTLASSSSSYTSIEFLVYSLALVTCTTGVMMMIMYLQIQYFRRTGRPQLEQQLLDRPVVGFSGVLFAWMVVQTLHYEESCPIPFLFPDVCFATHTIPFVNIRWNISPVVSLLVTQVMIRNASFVGHLSGIICGYIFVHISIVPFRLLVPQVLIPSVLIGHYWWIQGIMPVAKSNNEDDRDRKDEGIKEIPIRSNHSRHDDVEHDDNADGEELLSPLVDMPFRTTISSTADGHSNQLQSGNEANVPPAKLRNVKALRRVLKLMLCLSILSVPLFEYDMILGQVGVYILFFYIVQKYDLFLFHSKSSDLKEQRKDALVTLLRGFFVGAVINLVVDSMTVGCWMTSGANVWLLSQHPIKRQLVVPEFQLTLLVVFLRLVVNTAGLVMSAKVLGDDGGGIVRGGIFENCLGFVYRNAKIIGDYALVPDRKAFEGRGIVLGRTREISSVV